MSFFWDYISAVVFGWYGILLLITGAVDLYERASDKKFQIPPWTKTTVLAVGLFAAQFFVYKDKFESQNKNLRSGVGFLQFEATNPTRDAAPLFTVGKPIRLNIVYSNRGAFPITGASQFTKLLIKETNFSDSNNHDKEELEKFKKESKRPATKLGNTVGVGQRIWVTRDTEPISAELGDRLKQGKATLYLLGHAVWNEQPDGDYLCLKMQPPIHNPDSNNIVWAGCDL